MNKRGQVEEVDVKPKPKLWLWIVIGVVVVGLAAGGMLLMKKSSGSNLLSDGKIIDPQACSAENSKLWIVNDLGRIMAIDKSKNSEIYRTEEDGKEGASASIVFNNKLWIAYSDGTLESCDESGVCTAKGKTSKYAQSMAVYNNKLWLGISDGSLESCDESGACINHGVKINKDSCDYTGIKSMAIYDNQLWLGSYCNLMSCDSDANCKAYDYIEPSLKTYNNKLWFSNNHVAVDVGKRHVMGYYDSSSGFGELNSTFPGMSHLFVWNNKLWGVSSYGFVYCDPYPSGNCHNPNPEFTGEDYNPMGDFNGQPIVYNGEVWYVDYPSIMVVNSNHVVNYTHYKYANTWAVYPC